MFSGVIYCISYPNRCFSIRPSSTLPITLDLGTNNQSFLDDPLYLGLRQKRASEAEYDEFMEEFMTEISRVYPKLLVQFEVGTIYTPQRTILGWMTLMPNMAGFLHRSCLFFPLPLQAPFPPIQRRHSGHRCSGVGGVPLSRTPFPSPAS